MEECKRFLNEFGQKSCLSSEEEIIQYRNSGCYITENDLEGEITDWALQYLHVNKCPHNLAAVLAHETCDELMKDKLEACEDFKDLDKHEATNGDTKEIIRVFNPRKLLRTVHLKVHDVCRSWMDKEINFVEKTNRPVSVAAIKNSRRRMEDRHLAIPDLNVCFGLQNEESRGFYAIFDGHAGAEAATYASAHLHLNIVSHPEYLTNLEFAIREGFQKTEKDFLEKSSRENLKSGTTVLCAFVDQHKITVAWLGDSQAFLIKNGAPINLVTPHKPDRADEKDRIESLGGNVVLFGTWRVNGVLAVSRAIGDAEHKPYIISEPEIATVPLDGTEDFLILACDGLWDVMYPDDATNVVYSHLLTNPDDLEGISQKLVHIAVQQGSNDNITVQVVFLRSVKDIVASSPQVHLVQLDSTQTSSGILTSTDASESSPIECNESFDLVKNAYNAEMSSQFLPANSLDNLILKPEIESSSNASSEAQATLIKDSEINGIDGNVHAEKFESDQNLWISPDSPVIRQQKRDQFSIPGISNENSECDSQNVQEYFLARHTEVVHFLETDVKSEVVHQEMNQTNSSPLLSFDSKPFNFSPESESLFSENSSEMLQKEGNVSQFDLEEVLTGKSDSESVSFTGEKLIDFFVDDLPNVEPVEQSNSEEVSDNKLEEHLLNAGAALENVEQAVSAGEDVVENPLDESVEKIVYESKELEDHQQPNENIFENKQESKKQFFDDVELELDLQTVTPDQNLLLIKNAVENLNDVKDMIQSEPMSLEPITVEKIPECVPVADDVVDDESEDGEGWRYYHPDSISSDSGKVKPDQLDVSDNTKEISSELNVSLCNDENVGEIENNLKLASGECNVGLEDVVPVESKVQAEDEAMQAKDQVLKENKEQMQKIDISVPDETVEKDKIQQLTEQSIKPSGDATNDVIESPTVKTLKKSAKSTPPGKTTVRNAEKLSSKSDTTTKSPNLTTKITEKKTQPSKFVPPLRHDKVPSKLGTMKNVSSTKNAAASTTNESSSKLRKLVGTTLQRPKTTVSEPKTDSTDSKSSGTLPKRPVTSSVPKSGTMSKTILKSKPLDPKTTTVRKTVEKPTTAPMKTSNLTNVAKKPPTTLTGTLRQSSQTKPQPKTTSSVTSSSSKITKDTLNKRISSSTKETVVGVTNVENASKNETSKSKLHTNTLRTETTRVGSTTTTMTRKAESTLTKSRTGKDQIKNVKKESTVSGTIRKLPTKAAGVGADRKAKPTNEARLKGRDSTDKKSTGSKTLQSNNDLIDLRSSKDKLNASLVCSEKGSLDESTKEMPAVVADPSLLVELSSGDSINKMEEKLETSQHGECGAGGDYLSASSATQ